jgi:protein phosphatase
MNLEVRTGCAQHIGARASQQDAMEVVLVPAGGVLAILCDGMGGMEDGHIASQQAITAFRDCFLLNGSLTQAVAVANAAVAGLQKNTGTTLIAAHVTTDQFTWISVGDSPMYLLRGRDLMQVNRPHIFANRLPPSEAATHPERDALTSYIGIPILSEVDVPEKPVALQAGDCVILASDGLSRALPPLDIARTIDGDAQLSCESLVAKVLARKRPGQDNVSVIVASVDTDPPTRRPAEESGYFGRIVDMFSFWRRA